MALPENELRACLAAAGGFLKKRRPPPELRPKLDYRVDINNSQVLIIASRPRWDKEHQKMDVEVAKIRWINSRRAWRLYWMRGNGKWHPYASQNQLTCIAEVFGEIDRDPFGCFFG